MKTTLVFCVCLIFATLVMGEEEAEKSTDAAACSSLWTSEAIGKVSEIVCSELTAKELADKFNIQAPAKTKWRVVNSWFNNLRTAVITFGFVDCGEAAISAILEETRR